MERAPGAPVKGQSKGSEASSPTTQNSDEMDIWGRGLDAGPGAGSGAPSAIWSIKNTFLHVPNPSDDHLGLRKVKSANEMTMRFLGARKQLVESEEDELSITSQSDALLDDFSDEDDGHAAAPPAASLFNFSGSSAPPTALAQPQHPPRDLGQVRNVSFSKMPVVVEDDEPVKKTTEVNYMSVMVRNIPNRYSQQMLRTEIDKAGFKGKYNFFYLPIDFGQRANLGYAFIDFQDVETAAQFIATFEGEKLRKFKSRKILSISPAVYQGLPANLNHFAKAALQRITNPRFQPKVFQHGQAISFEAAYADLCAQLTGVRVR
jgi:hypothetical protein